MLKRYQVYLNPHSVGILDEVAELIPLNRSQIIREAIDLSASHLGNLIAILLPQRSNNYQWLDKMTGSIRLKGKGVVKLSENVDEIYYR